MPMQKYTGVVTFLDVLGWKGVWQRCEDPCLSLQNLAKSLRSNVDAKSTRGRFTSDPKSDQGKTQVTIISDTIVICTQANESNASKAIDLHGDLCCKVIPESICSGIPLRGATSFGNYFISEEENIFIGEAIDEAASWHELADWIGVFQTPSARYIATDADLKYWLKYKIPLKDKQDWYSNAAAWHLSCKVPEIKKHFLQMSPILPSILNKFENTLQFMTFDNNKQNQPTVNEQLKSIIKIDNKVELLSPIKTEDPKSIFSNVATQAINVQNVEQSQFSLNFNGRLLIVPYSIVKHVWSKDDKVIALILQYDVHVPSDTNANINLVI